MTSVTRAVLVATLLTVPGLVERAYAHHGAGLYDMRKNVELEGKITRVDFVNPHTYIYFDVVGADGKVIAMKCETRSATVLRRSGWSPEMFAKGATIKVAAPPSTSIQWKLKLPACARASFGALSINAARAARGIIAFIAVSLVLKKAERVAPRVDPRGHVNTDSAAELRLRIAHQCQAGL